MTLVTRDQARSQLGGEPPRRSAPTQVEILARQLSSLRDQCDAALGIVLGMLEQSAPEEPAGPTMPPVFGGPRRDDHSAGDGGG